MHLCSCVYVTQLQLEGDDIEKVQHNASVKSGVLERKLLALTDSVETTQAQLSSVRSVSNMDQTALSGIKHKSQVLLYIPLFVFSHSHPQ